MRFQELKTNAGDFCGVLDLETGRVLFNDISKFAEDAVYVSTECNRNKTQEVVQNEHNQRLHWFRLFVDCTDNIVLNVENESSWVAELRYNYDREILYVTTKERKCFEVYVVSWEEWMGVFEVVSNGDSVGSYVHELRSKHRYS